MSAHATGGDAAGETLVNDAAARPASGSAAAERTGQERTGPERTGPETAIRHAGPDGHAGRLGSLRRHASRLGGFRAGASPRHSPATLAPSSIRTPAAPSQVKIGIRGVGKVFRTRGSDRPFTAVAGVDLDVREGEFLTLVGPSGCGKSTLLDLIAGLTTPTDGEILIDGRAVDGPGLDRGIVFQQYALLPWRTALANIEFGLEAKAVPRRERRERARHYLDLVGLAGFEHRYPHELSGGMRQRVAIARSLAFDPDVLLMDEPFAALDAQTRESLQEELLRVWEKTRKTVVFITHGIDEAVYLGQRVAVMTSRPGRIKEIVDIRFDSREGDLRADPVFGEYRHHIWSLLRNEVAAGREQERTVD